MISLSHVTKRFGERVAVADLSFTIAPGEIVGFLGPNGAGKTTTLRMMTGALTPDAGTITVDGKDLQTAREAAQSVIGYLPESNPLYKDMLVSDFLSWSADMKQIPLSARQEALDFAVPAAGLEDVYHRPIGELSKGFKQRVGIAAAILHRPRVIILDEPTEGLDPNQRGDIRALIKGLAKEHTVILSTHILGEAAAMCDRFLLIHRGHLVADGTQQTLFGADVRTVDLDIEGAEQETRLAALPGVKDVQLTRTGTRVRGTLTLHPDAAALQPALMQEAIARNWTIWSLAERRPTLESLFQTLTKDV